MTITVTGLMAETRTPRAQTVPAWFPGDSRLSALDLCTCSLTRTCPKWGDNLLYTWGTVFPDITRACTVCSQKPKDLKKTKKNMAADVWESSGKSYDTLRREEMMMLCRWRGGVTPELQKLRRIRWVTAVRLNPFMHGLSNHKGLFFKNCAYNCFHYTSFWKVT